MTHGQAMVKAYKDMQQRLQEEAKNASSEAQRDVCLYLANDVIPDEVEFWQFEEEKEAEAEGCDQTRFCTECQQWETK